MNKKFTTGIALGSVAAIVAFSVAIHANMIKLPIERQIDALWVTDFSDDRKLIGASHNVFVGKVIRQRGNKDTGAGPSTQFEVEVVYNVKGDLSSHVTVDQQGGYKDGILYTVVDGDILAPNAESGDRLLQPGATYLFAARYNAEQNWYNLISHASGKKLISQDKNLNKAELQSLAQQDLRIKALQEAYKNEILLDADVRDGNTRNSYQSLSGNK